MTRPAPPGPRPVLGATFQVGPLSGRIYVRAAPAPRSSLTGARAAAASGFVALPESRTLPVGSLIDATGGSARITTATSLSRPVGVGRGERRRASSS